MTPPSSSIAAGGSATALVTIRVPADASPGERYGVVWAEIRSTASAAGVNEVSRVGIRLYLSVGPGGAPAADFVIDSLTAGRSGNGQANVIASVRNTGGRALDLSGSLELLEGPAGLRAGPFPAELGSTLAIGTTGSVKIELGAEIPSGPWTATVVLRSGLVERSARAVLSFPDSGAGETVRVQGGSLGLRLYLFVGLVLVATVGVTFGLMSTRRRAKTTRSR